jgi:prolyl 4-hydroxylase
MIIDVTATPLLPVNPTLITDPTNTIGGATSSSTRSSSSTGHSSSSGSHTDTDHDLHHNTIPNKYPHRFFRGHSFHHTSRTIHVLVAFGAWLIGLFTPPILILTRHSENLPTWMLLGSRLPLPSSHRMMMMTPPNQSTESTSSSWSSSLYKSTTTIATTTPTTHASTSLSERLHEFLHEEPVRGFHILCFQRSTPKHQQQQQQQQDEQHLQVHVDDTTLSSSMVTVTTYRNGVERNVHVQTLDTTMISSWDVLATNMITPHLPVPSSRNRRHPQQGWALYTTQGERIMDESSIKSGTTHDENDESNVLATLATRYGMVLLYEGGQFGWPGVRIGFQRPVALYTVMPPNSPRMANKNMTVTLETLSLSPLVLSVHGFLSREECEYVQQIAAPTMEYSEVALMDHDAGRPASDFRTSQTTFLDAGRDATLIDMDYRTASLVRLPRNHQESVQVLRYGVTERYVSHHDFFDPTLYQNDPETLELIQNGRRNRMLTVFWYLSTVEEGGETVFPRFHGLRETSAADCTTGLKVRPERGKVIIFYNMHLDGTVDPMSLHGACPVQKGVKWAANKWIWNEPMEYVPQ